jgi:hypothetical protein
MTLPITAFIIEKLLEFDPQFDTGSGDAMSGLFIEPLSVILQPVSNELAVIQAAGSILTILESSNPDAFPEDIVDALASNAIVSRKTGQVGSDVERLRFFEPQAFSAQQGVLVWLGPSGQRYTNAQPVSFTRAEMSLNQEGSLYYVDIPIVAIDQGASFNTAENTITSMETTPAGVASMSNLFGVSEGRTRETNTELINRIKIAVTVRALVTGRGIIVTLTENFASLVEVQPIGMGAPEMMRDIVYNVHIGGNVDIYVRASAFTQASQDVFGLKLDTTRQQAGLSVVSCPVADSPVTLTNLSVDRTSRTPTVKSIDGFVTFAEGVDYTISDAAGTITRRKNAVEDPLTLTPSTIFHSIGSGGTATDNKTLSLGAFFTQVRPGMIVTVTGPAAVAGRYTVKTVPNANTATIYGAFPGLSYPVAAVAFEVDENLSVSYDYNPASVDVIAAPRSASRTPYTITTTPVMLLQTIEVLDPLSGNPTGTLLDGQGGYGIGGFGQGGYGIGTGADYALVVAQPTLRFSAKEDNYIEFAQSQVGISVRVTYLWSSSIAAMQAFCDDRDNQSETASLIVKQFIPVYVDGQAVVRYKIPASTQATAISVAAMTSLVTDLITNISGGASLELSDLVDLLYNNGASEVDLDGLEKLRGSIHNENGVVQFVFPSTTGVMSIPSDPIPDPTDKPLSPRIARFVPGAITLSRGLA